MCSKIVLFAILSCLYIVLCEASQEIVQSRGKKKKIALFVYFADLVLKKFFVLKLIYAFVFWCIIHKAGYFLSWFVGYLKEKKEEHHHHPHDYSHEYSHQEYGPQYGASYGNHGPYRRQRWDS